MKKHSKLDDTIDQCHNNKSPKLKYRDISSRFLTPVAPKNSPSNSASRVSDHGRNEKGLNASTTSGRNVDTRSTKDPCIMRRQRSYSGYSRFYDGKDIVNTDKLSSSPFGGSVRFSRTPKFIEDKPTFSPRSDILQGRLSVDENALLIGSSDSPQSLRRAYNREVTLRPRRETLSSSENSCNNLFSRSPRLDKFEDCKSQGKLSHVANSKSCDTNTSKGKGLRNWLSVGLGLIKGKRLSSSASSPIRVGVSDSVHHLRLLHNSLIQWQFANAKADSVSRSISLQAKKNILCAFDSLTNLRLSVLHKKLEIQKAKLEVKLAAVLPLQVKALEMWEALEGQHHSAVTEITHHLHSSVCRIPLSEDARAAPQSVSVALRHAYIIASIMSMLDPFTVPCGRTVPLFSDLAEVVKTEEFLVQECFELLHIITDLEIKERCLRSGVMQLQAFYGQQLQNLF